MQKNKIWLSSPHMGGTEKRYIEEAFDHNWIAPLGPNVSGFENDIKEYLSGDDTSVEVAALSSGTAALHLALIMLDVKPGDEVICQSMTFAASANPIAYLGATPVFVDSEEDTLNICPARLEEAILDRIAKGKNIKAIIGVHLYGMPYKVEEIHEIAAKYNIPVIEDSAEALGSTYKGKNCGTFGMFGVLSFNGNKIITTSGGGALVTRSEKLKQKAIFLATQARDDAPHYQHSEIGYNYRLSNISAGIGRGQMEVLDKHVGHRREMNKFYQILFSEFPGVKVMKEPSDDFYSNHWLSVVLIDENQTGGISREDIRLALEKENIESRPLWKPMHLQPVFQGTPYFGNGVCEKAFESGLCLPSGSNLTDGDRDRISAVIKEIFTK
ncbi:aminotransferase class I/II-fold pyridoxal phosphate-dependent enzyme [Antarcticibacterium arcticum]|uniref:Aminotransferase class I/II-fold pyridoxal phosphate-dependent enzyme n=1 Tax=Antarcticibacterium arcticum TaxID=2585771 RepID=A0A5B8YG31_9FLAO|nr:aminotransferase class I/II-fold pyridoxal phosphate-dependent enzyme [Antarcticibacterium arcticum]QED36541.1 aminotransferase class I/II-fold pyridoxal phosphate-dependent enzyme [Antarcticibacterium arcticum]